MLTIEESEQLEEMLRSAADQNRFIQIEYAMNIFHAFLVDRNKKKVAEERARKDYADSYKRRQEDARRFTKIGKLYNGKSARQMLKEM